MDSLESNAKAKPEYFELLRSLSGPVSDKDDALHVREPQDRQLRFRFFRTPPPTTASGPTDPAAPVTAGSQQDARPKAAATCDRAHASSEAIIAGTQTQTAVRRSKRLSTRLPTGPVDMDEILAPDSAMPVSKAPPRSSMTPWVPAQRLGRSASEQSPSLGVGLRKRKRNSVQRLRPVEERIFAGFAFFYVPDNDIAPARRLRIGKAQEYGAVWTRDAPAVSHIIVDKNLSYADVEKVVPMARLTGMPHLVNEDYPIECIQFRSVLDHRQKKYQIAGQPAESAQQVIQKTTNADVTGAAAAMTPSWPKIPESDQSIDALSEVISMMQEFKDLPLDKEDESRLCSETGGSAAEAQEGTLSNSKTGEDGDDKAKRTRGQDERRGGRLEDKFACKHANEEDAVAGNPNSRTIEVLQSMADYYGRVNDQWRSVGYRRAISTLKRQSVQIRTEEEALRLPQVGVRIAQKIEEIVATDRLRRLEYAQDEATDRILQLFLQIHGVGSKQASQWVAQGYRSLDDLMRGAKLTAGQRIGIEHFEDLQQRIPRDEVEALGAVVRQAASRIDPAVQVTIGGSYRRGADSSGDVDLIVSRDGARSSAELRPLLDSLVEQLERDGFLVARLATSREAGDGSKWQGCCVLPKAGRLAGGGQLGRDRAVWRRIDLLLVPETERGAAQLYFTGNDLFNRSMRLLASRKGMRLNQRGLFRDGELLEGRDERRIFELLGVRWRKPRERWC